MKIPFKVSINSKLKSSKYYPIDHIDIAILAEIPNATDLIVMNDKGVSFKDIFATIELSEDNL